MSASGRSAPATVTDDVVDVTTCSWLDVPTTNASDLSWLSCRPFCVYHCLTSAVHEARTVRLSVVVLYLRYRADKKQTSGGEYPTHAAAIGVGNDDAQVQTKTPFLTNVGYMNLHKNVHQLPTYKRSGFANHCQFAYGKYTDRGGIEFLSGFL